MAVREQNSLGAGRICPNVQSKYFQCVVCSQKKILHLNFSLFSHKISVISKKMSSNSGLPNIFKFARIIIQIYPNFFLPPLSPRLLRLWLFFIA